MKFFKLICGVVTLMALAIIVPDNTASLYAASIVTNGGFETGDFTGWSQTGNSTFNGVQCPGPGPTVSSGNCSAFFGPIGSVGGISQVLSTVAGQSYDISFAFLPDGGTPSSFSAIFDGVTLIDLTNPAASSYQVFNFVATAPTSSTILAFNFRDDPGFAFLDAVSVDARAPETSSLFLLGPALAGLALAARKRLMHKI